MIYVDPLFTAVPKNPEAQRHGDQWCHMFSDTSVEELHEFAQNQMGMRRKWFHRSAVPHYDLTPGMRLKAIRKGAKEIRFEDAQTIRQMWRRQWHGGHPTWES